MSPLGESLAGAEAQGGSIPSMFQNSQEGEGGEVGGAEARIWDLILRACDFQERKRSLTRP